MIDKIIKWWNGQYEICEGCNKPITGDIFSYYLHHSEHIDGALGYHLYEEKFAPSTRVYFLKEKQKKGI